MWYRIFFAMLFWGGGMTWANHGSGPHATLDNGLRSNWYAWHSGCERNNAYIPLVHGSTGPEEITELMHSWCNDGRMLLVFNEPDRADQDATPPEKAADVLHNVVNGGWRGQIYAGNVELESVWWIDQLIIIYSDRYGDYYKSRYIPVQWGLHIYANFQVPGWTLTQANLQDDVLQVAVDRQAALLDQFIAKRKSEGNSTRFVVSEIGGLGRWGPGDNREAISGRMASLMRMYDTMLRERQRDGADSWFWYSSNSGAEGTAWWWPYGNMVDETGKLTQVGATWRELAAYQ